MPADMYVASIPKEELQEWLDNRTTKAVFKVLESHRQGLQEMVLNGQTLSMESAERTQAVTALSLGKISSLNLILDIKIEGE